jgi:hypothetical protein
MYEGDRVARKKDTKKESVADRMRRQARAFREGRLLGGECFSLVRGGSMHADSHDRMAAELCIDVLSHAELASLRGKYEARTVGALPSVDVEQRVAIDLTSEALGFKVSIERGVRSVVIQLSWQDQE